MNNLKPLRILQVLSRPNWGGVEAWLLNVLRHINRNRFQMDFFTLSPRMFPCDAEIQALGSRVIPSSSSPRSVLSFARSFHRALRKGGPYDIVHSNSGPFSGFVLYLARLGGVPVSIAHSHGDTSDIDAKASYLRQGYLWLMHSWIKRYATMEMACSDRAASALFGLQWRNDPKVRIHYCGIDLSPFETKITRGVVRAELGIPPEAFVIGNVGRFTEQKNHRLLLAISAALVRLEPATRILLIGTGELEQEVRQQVSELGLKEHVIFAGHRADVPRLMLGAMDAFLLPSLWEGLPLVGLEAQGAGLSVFTSDTVTTETDVVPGLVHHLPLLLPAEDWAREVLRTRASHTALCQSECLDVVRRSPFNIKNAIRDLEQIYEALSS